MRKKEAQEPRHLWDIKRRPDSNEYYIVHHETGYGLYVEHATQKPQYAQKGAVIVARNQDYTPQPWMLQKGMFTPCEPVAKLSQ